MRFALSALAFGVVLLTAAVPGLTTDVEAGKTAFKKCALCHSTDAAKSNKIGPSLFGVVGRKSASLDNFSYSEGLQKFDHIWDEETLDLYLGASCLLTIPRLRGTGQHRIDYHHIIDSLVRKPGAFAQYRYRDDLFPSLVFRRAYDQLVDAQPLRADQHYVRILHLAASTAESEVETALSLLLEANTVPTAAAVRELVGTASLQPIPRMQAPTLDLSVYDRLLPSRRVHA